LNIERDHAEFSTPQVTANERRFLRHRRLCEKIFRTLPKPCSCQQLFFPELLLRILPLPELFLSELPFSALLLTELLLPAPLLTELLLPAPLLTELLLPALLLLFLSAPTPKLPNFLTLVTSAILLKRALVKM